MRLRSKYYVCVFSRAGGTAVFYFVGGGRRRVPGLSTRPEQVCGRSLEDARFVCLNLEECGGDASAVQPGKRCESNTRSCKSRKMRDMLAVTVFVAAYSTRARAGGAKSAANTHLFKQAAAPPSATTRIHIGSCSDTHEPRPLWSVLEKRDADAFFWGGDVVYGDRDPAVLKKRPAWYRNVQELFSTAKPTAANAWVLDALYRTQAKNEAYRRYASSVKILDGIYDDHVNGPRPRILHFARHRRDVAPCAGLRRRQQPRPHVRPSHQGRAQECPSGLPRRAAGRRAPAAGPRRLGRAARG